MPSLQDKQTLESELYRAGLAMKTLSDEDLIRLGIDPGVKNMMTNGSRLIQSAQDAELKYKEDNKLEFFVPNPPQAKLFDAWKTRRYYTFGVTGSNQFGKTCTGVIIALSVMFGKFLWETPQFELYFPHKDPKKVRYICQDFDKTAKAVIVPEIEKWWPKNRPLETRNNMQGVKAMWIDVLTGSTLEIMTSKQEPKYHAGWKGDLIVFDEPMPKALYNECGPRLVARKGRELLCMTMLKEHMWIDQEIFKGVDEDGNIKTRIYVVNGDIYDNVGFGIPDEEAVDILIDKLKGSGDITDEASLNARVWGIPEYLAGMVLPQFDRQIHCIPRRAIPGDCIIDISIDVHPRKKQAILFAATGERLKWLVEEVNEFMEPEQIGHTIRKICMQRGYWRIGTILIDPLSKGLGNIRVGDDPDLKTVFEIVRDTLWSYGYSLRTAGPEKAMKKGGILELRKLLKGPNGMPSLFMFKDMVNCIRQLEGWAFMKDTEEPSKENDEFPENAYRLALLKTEWSPAVRRGRRSRAVNWRCV